MTSNKIMKVGGPRHIALMAGEKKYTGTPCRNCGSSIRAVVNGGCCDCAIRRTKSMKVRNKDKYNAESRAWYYANKERSQTTTKNWVAANSDRVREMGIKWRCENSEQYKHVAREWRIANRDRKTAIENNRRARKLSAPGRFTVEQVAGILAAQDFHCSYCDATENLQIDHVVPLCRGGSNWPWNLQWLCAHHNASKNDKTDIEYREIAGLPYVEEHLSLLLWKAVFVL